MPPNFIHTMGNKGWQTLKSSIEPYTTVELRKGIWFIDGWKRVCQIVDLYDHIVIYRPLQEGDQIKIPGEIPHGVVGEMDLQKIHLAHFDGTKSIVYKSRFIQLANAFASPDPNLFLGENI